MLPPTILPISDIDVFEFEPAARELRPGEALEPVVAFADILRFGIETPISANHGGGTGLPQAGKELPLPAGAAGDQTATGEARYLAGAQLQGSQVQARARTVGALAAASATLAARLPGAPVPAATQPLTDQPNATPLAAVIADLAPPATRPLPVNPDAGEPGLPQRPAADNRGPLRQDAELPAMMPSDRTSGTSLTNSPVVAGGIPAVPARQGPTVRELTKPDMPAPPHTLARAGHSIADERPVTPVAAPSNGAGSLPLQSDASPLQAPAAHSVAMMQAPTEASGFGKAAALPQLPAIATPVNDLAWESRIGERVMLMASNRLQSAEIRLTPAELGPLRIHIAIDDGSANVTFQAQHAFTREAIEQALPRLRELLAENGLTLNQADVSDHGLQQGGREDSRAAAPATAQAVLADDGAERDDAEGQEQPHGPPAGLVDTFA